MTLNPIIPIWLMGILCVVLLIFKRKGVLNYIRQIVIVVLLFAINLRIMVPNGEMTTMKNNVDVLFVIDNTISMLAEDYDGNGRRMDAVKNDCAYIMEQLTGASFSVVSFGNTITPLLPYTIDTGNVQQAIDALKGQTTLYATGTSFNDTLKYLENSLDRDNGHFQVVFFISDGEITQDETLKSYPKLNSFIETGAVLGYGTKEGGPMRAPAYSGDEEEPEELYYYDEDFNKKTALSKIDEGNLKSIADDMGVSYIHMTSRSKINGTLEEIKRQILLYADTETIDHTKGYADTYFYLLPPLILLLAIDFVYYKRKVKC